MMSQPSSPSSPFFPLSSFYSISPLPRGDPVSHVFCDHVPLRHLSSASSVHALSVAASRVEQALSEASSLQSSTPKHGPLHPWMTLAQIWLHAAEVYIGMIKPAEAMACTQEAASLFPTSHNVLFMKGQVAELRGNLEDAKRCYEEALAISPAHIRSMQRLGVILYQLQRFSLAEKVLCEAVQLCSSSHLGWHSLAEVLQAQGNMSAASECFLTALQLEASNPIMPFTILPRAL
ncbi:tetratricopeptide repeat protein 7B [Tachysurus ichikawai]